ncbi:MAG: hypothetical protein RRY47_04380 [Oscillospiraceae bacterium]
MIIADYVNAMLNKDYKALSECFSENCRLFDYCPPESIAENYYIYGKWAVDMFYHNKFVLGGLSVLDPRIMDERTVNLYINYGGSVNHAIANIESYDPQTGLIKEMVIRPA